MAFIIFITLTTSHSFTTTVMVSVVLGVLGICCALFSTMTVVCDREHLHIWIGHVIHRSFSIRDVVSSKVVGAPWYYGWGVRLVPHGWLYRVSGSHVVEIVMRNGKRYMIGTDEPQRLSDFINGQLE